MTRVYLEFLVQGTQLQVPVPSTAESQRITQTCRPRANVPAACASVARVRPRTSKGITDLLLLYLVWLRAICPSMKLDATHHDGWPDYIASQSLVRYRN